jgi:cytoskeletal protein RodZ
VTAVAQERLAARRRRLSRIRRAVAGAAVAVFLAAFSTIYVQMATGHDPALAASSKSKATVVASTASTDTESSSDDSSSSSSSSSSAQSSTPAVQPAPVTTRQS